MKSPLPEGPAIFIEPSCQWPNPPGAEKHQWRPGWPDLVAELLLGPGGGRSDLAVQGFFLLTQLLEVQGGALINYDIMGISGGKWGYPRPRVNLQNVNNLWFLFRK